MKHQEMQEENGAPVDHVVSGVTGSFALKDPALGVRELRSILNVRKEMESEAIREVRVTWVEPDPDPSVSKT